MRCSWCYKRAFGSRSRWTAVLGVWSEEPVGAGWGLFVFFSLRFFSLLFFSDFPFLPLRSFLSFFHFLALLSLLSFFLLLFITAFFPHETKLGVVEWQELRFRN